MPVDDYQTVLPPKCDSFASVARDVLNSNSCKIVVSLIVSLFGHLLCKAIIFITLIQSVHISYKKVVFIYLLMPLSEDTIWNIIQYSISISNIYWYL